MATWEDFQPAPEPQPQDPWAQFQADPAAATEQPGYGQSLLSAAGRGFASVVPGVVGGVGYLTGSEGLVQQAEDIEQSIAEALPINPAFEDDFAMKAASTAGQVGSILATGGAAGVAGKALQGVRLAGQAAQAIPYATGVLQGVRGGGQEAEQYGMEGAAAYGRALAGGAIEGLVERLPFGMLTETAAARRLLGEAVTPAGSAVREIASGIGTEATEEGLAQIGGNVATMGLAPAGVETPGLLEGVGEAAALGAVGGAAFGGVNALVRGRPQTIESGEAEIPESLRVAAEAGAFPNVDELENLAGAAATEEVAAAVRQAAEVGGAGFAPVEPEPQEPIIPEPTISPADVAAQAEADRVAAEATAQARASAEAEAATQEAAARQARFEEMQRAAAPVQPTPTYEQGLAPSQPEAGVAPVGIEEAAPLENLPVSEPVVPESRELPVVPVEPAAPAPEAPVELEAAVTTTELETLVPAAEPVSAVETPVAPAPLEEALPPITAEVTQPQPEPTEPNASEIRQIIEDGQLQYQDTDEGGPQAVSGRGNRLVEGGQVAAEGQEVTATPEQQAGLLAVANNTATPEQVEPLVQRGLVRTINGQNVITDAGVALMPPEQRPRLTEAERVAEIQQITPTGVVPTESLPAGQPTPGGVGTVAGQRATTQTDEGQTQRMAAGGVRGRAFPGGTGPGAGADVQLRRNLDTALRSLLSTGTVDTAIAGQLGLGVDAGGASIPWPSTRRAAQTTAGTGGSAASGVRFVQASFPTIRNLATSLGAVVEVRQSEESPLFVRTTDDGSIAVIMDPSGLADVASKTFPGDAEGAFQYISTALYEELIHVADSAVLRDRWSASGRQVPFNQFLSSEVQSLWTTLRNAVSESSDPARAQEVLNSVLSESWRAYTGSAFNGTPEQFWKDLQRGNPPVAMVVDEFVRQMVQQDLIGTVTETSAFRALVQRVLDALNRVISALRGAPPEIRRALLGRVEETKARMLQAIEQAAPQTINIPQTDTTPPAEPPLPPASMRAEQMARKRRGKAGVPQSVRDQDGAAVDVRVTPAEAQRAREIEGKQIPGVSEAWVGTTDEFLAEFGDLPDFDRSTTAVRADGGLEAFYDPKMDRAFILIDRAQAREGDTRRAVRQGTTTGIETVRRLLRHEAFAHRGWRALPTNLKAEFIHLLPNLITPDDIDSLVAKGYARYANWREDPLIYYMAAEEWLATRIERISKLPRAQQGKWTDFMDWLKRVFQWLTGDDTVEPTPKELTDIMRQMVRALEVREAEVRAPEVAGIRPSYVGEKAQMSQFMRDSLEAARNMAAAGKSREEIRAVTGWFPGDYDGKMRWEIPDNEATFVDADTFKRLATDTYGGAAYTRLSMQTILDRVKSGNYVRLSDVLNHPLLFEAYPEAANIPIFPIGGNIVQGSHRTIGGNSVITATVVLENGRISDETVSVILHELQHYIQQREGFAEGGSPDSLLTKADLLDAIKFRDAYKALGKYRNEIAALVNSLAEERAKTGFLGLGGPSKARIKSLEDHIASIQESVNAVWKAQGVSLNLNQGSTRAALLSAINKVEDELGSAWVLQNRSEGLNRIYRLLAGEIEARDVQARRNLTQQQRQAIAPYSSENISPDDAIVVFTARDRGDSAVSSSLQFSLNDREQRLSDIANSGSGKYRESDALPFTAEAVPGRPVREVEGQTDIARNLNYQETKLDETQAAAIKFVDNLGPVETWFDQLANPAWQQEIDFDPRSIFGQYVLTEAVKRTQITALVDPAAFTANRQLADYLNATGSRLGGGFGARAHIHRDPRYIAMFATQGAMDLTRKQQKTVIDPQVNVPQAVEAVQVADQRAREQATTETAEELDLDQIVLDMGMAALDPTLREDIREINNHVLRIGTLQRLRQRLTSGVSQSLANLSAADLEAQYAGLTVEQIDTLLAQEQEALAARVAKVKGAMAGKPKQRVAAADSPVEQARKLIERLEAAPSVKKPGKPNPVRDLYKRHLKDPLTEADFVREMAAIGIPLEQATKLYELAAIKIAAVEMARQARREASQEGKLSQVEKFAERTIDDVAQLMADPALPESERERKVLPIRELYNDHVRTGIEEESFVQQAIKLGLDEGRARRLWGAGTLVREARTRAKAAISEQAAIDKANKQEQRQIEMADKEAARIIYNVSRLHRQSGYINTSKDAPTIRKIFAEQVKKPETFEVFSDKLKPFKVSPGVITRLFNVAERETLARQAMEVDRKNLAEMRKLNARAANLLDPSKGSLLNALNKLRGKVMGDVNWSKVFEAPFERQQQWRVELYRALRADPALANLTPQEARDLAAEVDRIWNLKRQKAFDDQMKRVNLPGVKPEAKKKVQESAPQLLRYINVGTFGDDSFRQAVSKKFGIKALSADEIKRITELAQAAQAEGISTPERSRILDELVKTLQSSRNAEIGEILSNYWVTSVLSGFRTQFDTALAFLNGLRVMSQGVAYSAITKRDFKLAGRAAKDYFKTLADTISEAVAYFVTGDPTLLDGYQYGLQTFFKEGVAASAPYDYFEQVIKSKDARALAKFSAYFMAGVQRAMRAFDHINSVSTTEGWKSLAVTLDQKRYRDARLPTPGDVEAARKKALDIVGSDKGFTNRAKVSAATRQILNDTLNQEFPGLLDEAREIGLISSYQNDPTGIGGIIYHTLLGVTNKAVQAAGKFRDQGIEQRAASEWSEARKLTDKALRGILYGLAVNSRNITGTRFVRFAGNRFNELLSFLPGAGLLRLYEKDMTESKRAMLITNNIVGGMLGLAVFTTLLRMLSDEEDDEKRGFRLEGSWANLTPDQKNQLRSQGRSPYTLSFYDGDGKWSNFNYNSWPVAGILAAAGTLNDLRQYAPEKWDAKDMLDRFVSAAWAGVTTFKDLSALSGLMDLLGTSAYASGDPVESAKKWAAKFTANFGGGFIPRAVKDIDAMMDPEIRKPDDMAAYFAKEVPFFRRLEVGGQKLFNIFGDPVEIKRTPWSRSYTQAELGDEYRTLGELNSRGLFLGAANPTNRTIGSGPTRRELTDREAELYMQTAGKFYKDYIRSQGERLLRLPNEQAKKAISQDTERLRNAALRRAVMEAKKEGT